MKKIVFIITIILVCCILASAISFNQTTDNTCISLQCTNVQLSETMMEESAIIIENRLKDIGHKPSKVTIKDGGIIEICFRKGNDLIKNNQLLTSKGTFEFYETVDRNTVLKNVKKEDSLFSSLIIPEMNSERAKISNSVLGYYSEINNAESLAFTNSLNKSFGVDLKFALSVFKDKEQYLSLFVLKSNACLDGNSISEIKIGKDKKMGVYSISMNFDAHGTKKWAEITRNSIGKEITMVLDDRVYFAPTVMAEIKEGKSMITGIFSEFEASVLQAIIKNGEIPLDFKVIQ
jgi:preprotein translocase subunit SecD